MSWINHRWSRERDELLRQLRERPKPKSYSLCARTLGGFEHTKDGGRSAIAGRVRRLNIAKTGIFTEQVTRTYTKPRARRPKRVIPMSSSGDLIKIETPLRCTLEDVPDKCCHWPVTDDSPFLFCGVPRCDEHPRYCAYHFFRSIRKSEPETPIFRAA